MLVDKPNKKFRKRYAVTLLLVSAGYLFFYFFPDLASQLTFCPFKTLYGIACPACGTTRATLLMLDGQWIEAIWINPLAILTHIFILICCLWMFKDILTRQETFLPALQKKWKPIYLIPILLLFALNMWWNWKKGL